jgi:hypothetical protein
MRYDFAGQPSVFWSTVSHLLSNRHHDSKRRALTLEVDHASVHLLHLRMQFLHFYNYYMPGVTHRTARLGQFIVHSIVQGQEQLSHTHPNFPLLASLTSQTQPGSIPSTRYISHSLLRQTLQSLHGVRRAHSGRYARVRRKDRRRSFAVKL